MAPRLDANETGVLPNQFLRLYRDLRAARTPMESAIAQYRNVLKRCKDAGVDTFALGLLEKLVKVEVEQAALHIRNLSKYADWTQSDVGLKQADLFGGTDGQAPSEDVALMFTDQLAEENGYRAGLAGDSIDFNPHQAGASQHAAWARGWHRGQADAVTRSFGTGPKPPKEPKTPTRRARNPAAETKDAAAPEAGEDASEQRGEPEPTADNVFPIHAARPARGAAAKAAKAAKTSSPRAIKAARAAAAKLSGEDVSSAKPAF